MESISKSLDTDYRESIVNFIHRLVTASFHILFPRAPPCVNLSLHFFGPQHVWSFVATAGREKVSLYSKFI